MIQEMVECPLRIDFCGGFSDIEEINKIIGTSIINVSCRLKSIEGDTFTIKIIDQLNEASSAFIAYEKKFYDTDYYSKKLFLESNHFDSLGMGSSSALSIIVILYLAKCHKDALIENEIFTRAKILESEFMHIKGGVQDFVGIINGGYNWVKNIDNITLSACKFIPHNIKRIDDYINNNTIFISCKSKNKSNNIINNIVDYVNKDEKLDDLKIIKKCNDKLGELLMSTCSTDDFIRKFTCLISESWEAQKRLDKCIVTKTMKAIETNERNNCYAIHGTGAGGRGLILYLKKRITSEYVEELVSKYGGIEIFTINTVSDSIIDIWNKGKASSDTRGIVII